MRKLETRRQWFVIDELGTFLYYNTKKEAERAAKGFLTRVTPGSHKRRVKWGRIHGVAAFNDSGSMFTIQDLPRKSKNKVLLSSIKPGQMFKHKELIYIHVTAYPLHNQFDQVMHVADNNRLCRLTGMSKQDKVKPIDRSITNVAIDNKFATGTPLTIDNVTWIYIGTSYAVDAYALARIDKNGCTVVYLNNNQINELVDRSKSANKPVVVKLGQLQKGDVFTYHQAKYQVIDDTNNEVYQIVIVDPPINQEIYHLPIEVEVTVNYKDMVPRTFNRSPKPGKTFFFDKSAVIKEAYGKGTVTGTDISSEAKTGPQQFNLNLDLSVDSGNNPINPRGSE